MAKKSLLTHFAKTASSQQTYYYPSAVLPYASDNPLGTFYCFLARTIPWEDDENPPDPLQTQKYIKETFKNIFVAKRIYSGDISPVIERKDWELNTVYDYYRDDVDMLETDENGYLIKSFYVKNRYDQVFKCLWNNDGGPSLEEPYFEPGTYSTNNIFQGNDLYKWKYIYSIDTGLKVKFMDSVWMPVPVSLRAPNPLLSRSGSGSIDVINVLNGGQGYDLVNSVITVTVTGDGNGATATVTTNEVANGVITDIVVETPGSNYTYANVIIKGVAANGALVGTGATAFCPTSPVGGHGFDPISELGCNHVMYTTEFNKSESATIPTDNNYYQVGLLLNPVTKQNPTIPANGVIYRTSTDLLVAPGFGTYSEDEYVYQVPNPGDSLSEATFVGTVLSFNTSTNTVKLINTIGTPNTNAPLFGNSSGTTRTALTIDYPLFELLSGYMIYLENRSGVERSPDGIEQYKIVLGY
jgi:hypothetical protein